MIYSFVRDRHGEARGFSPRGRPRDLKLAAHTWGDSFGVST
jgi:hypothetical protein